jgi:hypothetical protein
MQKKSLLFCTLLLGFSLAAADFVPLRTLYVSPRGDDNQSGLLPEQPLRSINKATQLIQPGDLVLVSGGRYQEQVVIKTSGTAENPIVFRAQAGETALLDGGFLLTGWTATAGREYVYETDCPYAINMLWERCTLNRSLEVNTLDMVAQQPGGYFHDLTTGKLYVRCLNSIDLPEQAGIVIVPLRQGGKPLPYNDPQKNIHLWDNAVFITSSYIHWENFEIAFYPASGVRVQAPAEHCVVRGNTIYGTTCGIKTYGEPKHILLENNMTRRICGSGIMLSGKGDHITVHNNILDQNGPCPPYLSNHSCTEGTLYNLCYYGGEGTNFTFTDNLVISDDSTRRCHNNTMRCKGAVRQLCQIRGNVFVGGSVELYIVPDSQYVLQNNTILRGKIYYSRPPTGNDLVGEERDNVSLDAYAKPEDLFANPGKYDFRPLPGSPHLGKGASPQAAPVRYLDAGIAQPGNGETPATAGNDLQKMAQSLQDGQTLYFLPGTYTGTLTLSGKNSLSLLAYGSGEVIFQDVILDASNVGKLKLEGISCRGGSWTISGGQAEISACLFDAVPITGKDAQITLKNSTLVGDKTAVAAGKLRLVLRNNLFVGYSVLPAQGTAIISENNAFVNSPAAFKLWQQQYTEAHPRFALAAELTPDYRLPPGSALAQAGLGGATAIGGRAAPPVREELQIADLQAEAILPTLVKISWRTPNGYADSVSVRPNQGAAAVGVQQGSYKQSSGQAFLHGLKPGTEYQVNLYFYPLGESKPVPKQISYTTPLEILPSNSTCYVDAQAGADSNSGLSLAEAKRTLAAAIAACRGGDTILLAPGVYTGQMDLHLDGVTIKALQPGTACLNAAYLYDYVLKLNQVKDVILDGLAFVGLRYSASVSALIISNSKNVTVQNCLFNCNYARGSSGCANIQLMGTGRIEGLKVHNCVFHSGFHGIWLLNWSDQVEISNCAFTAIGTNAIHLACDQEAKISVYNNIFHNLRGEVGTPGTSFGTYGKNIFCDYNLHWNTKNPTPKISQITGGAGNWSGPFRPMPEDTAYTLQDAREKYGFEKHSLLADPKFGDLSRWEFAVGADSPALGQGRDGGNIGPDMSVFGDAVQGLIGK